ncbi:MAG: alpha/beta hydrolase [Chloroflexi bacterium]|nr:alpha/beta hydrolase [Chloroflexota bacterium]
MELRVRSGAVDLAGTLWLPASPGPHPAVLMVGGSGPTDRDNDVYFPPIRARLLERGIAVASFDKRGVGESTGDWYDGGPAELTADALAEAAALRDHAGIDAERVGLFGHSQGGWVVLEAAAADRRTAFVITNSGPGVTPAVQERFSVATRMRRAGRSERDVEGALGRFDAMVDRIRSGASLEAVADLASDEDLSTLTLVPTSADVLRLMRPWIDHDPRSALERIRAPMLAIFGSVDPVVPVEDSLAVMRTARAGRPGGLTEFIIEGGDHRSFVGDPPTVPDRYHQALGDWILAQGPTVIVDPA